jgi:hypothetical protein
MSVILPSNHDESRADGLWLVLWVAERGSLQHVAAFSKRDLFTVGKPRSDENHVTTYIGWLSVRIDHGLMRLFHAAAVFKRCGHLCQPLPRLLTAGRRPRSWSDSASLPSRSTISTSPTRLHSSISDLSSSRRSTVDPQEQQFLQKLER